MFVVGQLLPEGLAHAGLVCDRADPPLHLASSGRTRAAVSGTIEYQFGPSVLPRNHTRFADPNKFYRNVLSRLVNDDGTEVRIVG